ncbi:MAG: hypothetical protein AAFX76_12225, partial [Planctomycetota bacterium]
MHGAISHARAGGLTLAEALFASAVLALVVAALSQTVVSGQSHTYNALHEARALSLAEALMEEVLALPYTDPGGDTAAGPDAGESARDTFDAVDEIAMKVVEALHLRLRDGYWSEIWSARATSTEAWTAFQKGR